MPDFADNASEGICDHRTRQHRREQSREQCTDGKADDEPPQRGLDRREEFGFGDHGHERPARKRQRRQCDLIGRAVEREPAAPRIFRALVARLVHRHARQRQHIDATVGGMQLVGVLVGGRDQFTAVIEDERRARPSDLEQRVLILDARGEVRTWSSTEVWSTEWFGQILLSNNINILAHCQIPPSQGGPKNGERSLRPFNGQLNSVLSPITLEVRRTQDP
jgi:hypothetical protein